MREGTGTDGASHDVWDAVYVFGGKGVGGGVFYGLDVRRIGVRKEVWIFRGGEGKCFARSGHARMRADICWEQVCAGGA